MRASPQGAHGGADDESGYLQVATEENGVLLLNNCLEECKLHYMNAFKGSRCSLIFHK